MQLSNSKLMDLNSYYAYHTNLSYTERDGNALPAEEKESLSNTNTRNGNGNDPNTCCATASLSHSLNLGSVNEKCYSSHPTTAAEDNNRALKISSCKPLKFPLASEWLV